MLLAPLAFAILIFASIYNPPRRGVRASIVLAMLMTATAAVLQNELLSAFSLLTAGWLGTGWAVCVLAAGLWLIKSGSHSFSRDRWQRRWRTARRGIDGVRLRALIVVILICATTGLIAFLAAPNNFDSNVYHLPRVMHWIQNQRVAPFATSIDRQLYQHPGAEHLQLQAMLLGVDDRMVNFVQWCALLCSGVTAALIARALGARPTSQWVASLLSLTLPMAILQSTNTKNDLLMACAASLAVWQILEVRRSGLTWPRASIIGITLGWMLLIKGTCYAFVPPLAICLLIASVSRGGRGLIRLIPKFALIGVIAALLILPHWRDNAVVFGSPLGPVAKSYSPSGPIAAAATINLARNLGTCLTTPIEPLNNALEVVLTRALSIVGLDIQDTRSLNYSNHFQLFGSESLSEDNAGAPFHVALFLFTIPLILTRGTRLTRTYLLAIICATLFFSAIVSWNQWISRLFLPLLMLLPPLMAVTLRIPGWPPRVQKAVPLACLILALPYLLINTSRPLIGPKSVLLVSHAESRFALRPELAASFAQAVEQVRKRDIRYLGLSLGADEWEYPVWQALRSPPAIALEHVGVDNASIHCRSAAFVMPDWILDVGDHGTPTHREWENRDYRLVWGSLYFSLYETQPPPVPPATAPIDAPGQP